MSQQVTASPSTPAPSKYRPEIDGLRAIAVIAVIINHFNKDALPAGFLGVDIFFVISGYVITASLATRKHHSFKEFILGFYERRIKRIFPALIVCLIVTCFIGFLFIDPLNGIHASSWRTGATALFGLSNIYLLRQSLDYFGSVAELNLFTQTWSLGVEEQFYFLYPLIFWLSGFGLQKEHGRKIFLIIISSLSIVSLGFFIYLSQNNPSAMYFLMPSRFWEMGAGCLIFLTDFSYLKNKFKNETNLKKGQHLFSLISLALIILSLLIPLEYQLFSTSLAVIMSVILIATTLPSSPTYQLLTIKPFTYIGLLSYSLYLWHWSVIVISRWTIGLHWWSIPFQVALICLFGFLSYRFIETPLRRMQWSPVKIKTIGYGISASLASVAILFGFAKASTQFIYSGSANLSLRTMAGVNYKERAFPYPIYSQECGVTNKRSFAELPKEGCSTNIYQRKIYFLGNSHAHHLRTLHYLLHFEHGFDIESITEAACPFPANPKMKGCSALQADRFNKVLESVQPDDLVVISNRYSISSHDDPVANGSWIEVEPVFEQLKTFAAALQKKNVPLILFLPLPEFGMNIEECTPQWFKPRQLLPEQCQRTVEEFRNLRSKTYQFIQENLPESVYTYDPLPSLCPQGNCQMTDSSEKPLSFDSDHLTDYAVETYIYPDFLSFLTQENLIKN